MIVSEGSTLVTFEGRTARVEPYLRKVCEDMEEDVKGDDDAVIIIDGRTGSGKSVFAQLMGWFLSKGKLVLSDIVFLPDTFEKRVHNSKKYEVIIYDESYLGLAARDAMSGYNRKLMRLLQTCRKKNLYLILCIPSVFDMDQRVPYDRAKCLINIEKKRPKERYYYYYNQDRLVDLYRIGKEKRNHKLVRPNFWGESQTFYAVNKQEYEAINNSEVERFEREEDERLRKSSTTKVKDLVLAKALRMIKEDKNFNNDDMGNLFNVDRTTISKYLTKLQEISPTSDVFDGVKREVISINTPKMELDDDDRADTSK